MGFNCVRQPTLAGWQSWMMVSFISQFIVSHGRNMVILTFLLAIIKTHIRRIASIQSDDRIAYDRFHFSRCWCIRETNAVCAQINKMAAKQLPRFWVPSFSWYAKIGIPVKHCPARSEQVKIFLVEKHASANHESPHWLMLIKQIFVLTNITTGQEWFVPKKYWTHHKYFWQASKKTVCRVTNDMIFWRLGRTKKTQKFFDILLIWAIWRGIGGLKFHEWNPSMFIRVGIITSN